MNYTKILLVEPDCFDVIDSRNPHMNSAVPVNKDLAMKQWDSLVLQYRKLVEKGDIAEMVLLGCYPDLVDLVFCANAGLTWKDKKGNLKAFMSAMRHDIRRAEIPYITSFLENEGYEISTCDDGYFEGMGDCIWHPTDNKLFCGHGYRTSRAGLECFKNSVKEENFSVIELELCDPRFYHLDMCFLPLSWHTVLIYHQAFTPDALRKIVANFKNVEFIAAKEALNFALNGHIIRTAKRRRDVCIIQKGNPHTEAILKREKIRIINCDLSEFNKSGGSVFCMKLEFN
jgi:N-dimethylarginine dimethylaminohydrolase